MVIHYNDMTDYDEEYKGEIDYEIDENDFDDWFKRNLKKVKKALKDHAKDLSEEQRADLNEFYPGVAIEDLVVEDPAEANIILFELVEDGKVPELMDDFKEFFYEYAQDEFNDHPWDFAYDYEGEARDLAYEISRDMRDFGV